MGDFVIPLEGRQCSQMRDPEQEYADQQERGCRALGRGETIRPLAKICNPNMVWCDKASGHSQIPLAVWPPHFHCRQGPVERFNLDVQNLIFGKAGRFREYIAQIVPKNFCQARLREPGVV